MQGFLARRFPTITAATRAAGYDWTAEPIPVSPAAHYWMGGVSTDLWGRTSVPGLYAAGEVARTGVQGANRLASNSLLEGLVFGRRAVEAFLAEPASWPVRGRQATADATSGVLPGVPAGTGDGRVNTVPAPGQAAVPFSREALGRLMTGAAGVMRTGAELDAAGEQLAALGSRHRQPRIRQPWTGPATRTGTCCSPPGCSSQRRGSGQSPSAPTTGQTPRRRPHSPSGLADVPAQQPHPVSPRTGTPPAPAPCKGSTHDSTRRPRRRPHHTRPRRARRNPAGFRRPAPSCAPHSQRTPRTVTSPPRR